MAIKRLARLSVIVFISVVVPVGYTMSKAKYEAKMEQTPASVQEDLAPIEKKPRKAGGSAREEVWADQAEVLERTVTRAMMVHCTLMGSSTSALFQALRELPFLEYEIKEAFGGLSGSAGMPTSIAGEPPKIVHADKVPRTSKMDKAIYCADSLTGFLVACALGLGLRSYPSRHALTGIIAGNQRYSLCKSCLCRHLRGIYCPEVI